MAFRAHRDRRPDGDGIEISPDDRAADALEAAEPDGADSALGGDVAGDKPAPDETKATEKTEERPPSRSRAGKLLRVSFSASELKDVWEQAPVWRIAVVAIIIYVAIVNAGYFFLLKPNSDRFQNVKEAKEVLHDFSVIQECSAAMSAFRDGLMTGDQRLTVMSEVHGMAREASIRILGDPDLLVPRDVSDVVKEYPVRLKVSGGYHEIGRFLALLENSPRFIQIEEVEITSDVASKSSDSEATITLALASWEE